MFAASFETNFFVFVNKGACLHVGENFFTHNNCASLFDTVTKSNSPSNSCNNFCLTFPLNLRSSLSSPYTSVSSLIETDCSCSITWFRTNLHNFSNFSNFPRATSGSSNRSSCSSLPASVDVSFVQIRVLFVHFKFFRNEVFFRYDMKKFVVIM